MAKVIRLEGDFCPVPYSIDKTSQICSACLEYFNIIGANFSKKYLVPCPGAVLFCGMAANRYYEVLRANSFYKFFYLNNI
jgi:hypothetical protein